LEKKLVLDIPDILKIISPGHNYFIDLDRKVTSQLIPKKNSGNIPGVFLEI
jgi:hypothetical protein